MKTDVFPVNYFKSIWTPISAFRHRHQLGWPGIVTVLFFLNALLTIPVTLHYAQMDTFPLERVYPKTAELMKQQPVDAFQAASYKNGKMKMGEPFLYSEGDGVVGGGLNQEEAENILAEDTVILFEETHLLLKESGLPTSTVSYTQNFSLENTENGAGVVEEVSRQWFAQNKVFVVAFFSLLLSGFLFVMLGLLVFGASVFLYLTKSSPLTSISTYKESVNLLLNLITLPTVAAMFAGLIRFDISWMLMLQTFGLMILLLVLYAKTTFNDNKLTTAA
ncbi:DUF1189 family protein [Atopococcus tabaci]|uniref:DUF1189 family protein n=1 Tax=Atopococcus tabaci TaxID=269774 RepID=UPI000401AFAD|nr:DUF1189 family protein [Atopococcus tabaci]